MAHEDMTEKVGNTEFSYGVGPANAEVVACLELSSAAPFYARIPEMVDVPLINAPILFLFNGAFFSSDLFPFSACLDYKHVEVLNP